MDVIGYVVAFAVAFLVAGGTTYPRLVRDLYRHGFDNHLCRRDCCRFDG